MYKNRASAGKPSAIPGSHFTSRQVLNEVLCLLSGHENCYLIGEKLEAKPPLLIFQSKQFLGDWLCTFVISFIKFTFHRLLC